MGIRRSIISLGLRGTFDICSLFKSSRTGKLEKIQRCNDGLNVLNFFFQGFNEVLRDLPKTYGDNMYTDLNEIVVRCAYESSSIVQYYSDSVNDLLNTKVIYTCCNLAIQSDMPLSQNFFAPNLQRKYHDIQYTSTGEENFKISYFLAFKISYLLALGKEKDE
ncbi:hypothetical protein RF11_16026 [Thelohanellus kitauei]|uniref:Uncharacterized protein n=1 Tax=Thelohanellus kitauei TaxID=669202 RepID=A0A0C2IMB6_THEKT|nr:hypothetical protein RF11_16026 [Thelohanellus kitauei]